MGLQSLPVAFGVETAKYICVASIDATQVRQGGRATPGGKGVPGDRADGRPHPSPTPPPRTAHPSPKPRAHHPPTPTHTPQLGVAAYLAFGLNEPVYGAVLLGLILPQVGRCGWWGHPPCVWWGQVMHA